MSRRLALAFAACAAAAALLPGTASAQYVPESSLQGPAFSMDPNAPVPLAPPAPGTSTPGTPGAPGVPGVPGAPPEPEQAVDPVIGPYIQQLQQLLPSHGYRPGPVTGVPDPRTIAAIESYQRDARLPLGLEPETLQQTVSSVEYDQPPVRAGDRSAPPYAPPAYAPSGTAAGIGGLGADTQTLAYVQGQLARRGFDPGPVDGYPGPRTVEAIRSFQAASGLPVTGQVDQNLLQALER